MGYVDPDYMRAASFAPSHDFYASGVVMLQLLTKRLALVENGTLVDSCVDWLREPSHLPHQFLDGGWPMSIAIDFADVAAWCVGIRDKYERNRWQLDRPTARQLLDVLIPLTTANPAPPPNMAIPRDCLVCMEQLRAVRFIPCGHLCCCAECGATVATRGTRSCPVCRARIQSSVPANATEASFLPSGSRHL